MRKAVLACIFTMLCLNCYAQQQNPNITIRSNSRLVVVDVVVTGPDAQPITGLTRNDFTIYEDGKPQSIRSFDAHVYDNSAPQPLSSAASLAPNEYTNIPRTVTSGATNVVLLDMLNTQVADQVEARRQMLAFLKKMPRGQNLAVFTLTHSQIRMINGVTTDSSELLAMVDKLLARKSVLIKTDEDRSEELAAINDVKTISPNAAQAMADFFSMVEQRGIEDRIQITTSALQSIARVMAGYPGRKNLVWISGGFPISFDPSGQFGEQYSHGINSQGIAYFAPRIRETASLLAAAHVAIYPVDARGLISFTPAVNLPLQTGSTIAAVNANNNLDIIGAMKELADVTGGKAFYNANDLDVGITRSIALGSSYYSLTYTPSNPQWDGHFRKLKVSVARPKVDLAYRHGYYALPDNTKPDGKQLHNDMASAMVPVSAESTALLFKATVVPPGQEGKVTVVYAVPPGQVPVRDLADNPRDLDLELVVAAWDDKGNSTGNVAESLRLSATSQAAADVERIGFTKSQQLVIKPGTTQLRVGLMDRNTGRIGTINVPIAPQSAGTRRMTAPVFF